MTATCQCLKEDMFDWESPAGGAGTCARLRRCAYVYLGSGSRHWLGQPCDILSSDTSADRCVDVVLACGCRTRATLDCLIRPPN
jgi:hypothetical protein